jgi:hypothetical protein
MKAALQANFELLDEKSERGGQPTDDSVKGHFVYRRQP